ncbi:hypothetical protein HN873_009276, partial [Arachis hypogaea]
RNTTSILVGWGLHAFYAPQAGFQYSTRPVICRITHLLVPAAVFHVAAFRIS